MSIVSFATLKGYFAAGARPTQSNFEDLVDTVTGRATQTAVVGTDAEVTTDGGLTVWELDGTIVDRDHISVFINGARVECWTLCSGKVCFDYLLDDGYMLAARYWS